MATVQRFEELLIWQKSREMSKDIFRIINYENFAKDYRFKSQIWAATGSIMDNIAEGYERSGNKEFVQFLYIAKGSCGEVRSQLHRALDCGYILPDEFETLKNATIDISQSISNFIKYLKQSEIKGTKYL